MGFNELDRYDRTKDGSYIISVRVESLKALFNEYDFSSSFTKRDLKEDFVEYLIECVEEIGRRSFIIRAHIPKREKSEKVEHRLKDSIHNYFLYLIRLAKKEIRRITTKILFNFSLSISLLIIIFFVSKGHSESDSVWFMIFNEGLYVAIWVLMWPVFSDFLFDLRAEFRKIKFYRRIIEAKLEVAYY